MKHSSGCPSTFKLIGWGGGGGRCIIDLATCIELNVR